MDLPELCPQERYSESKKAASTLSLCSDSCFAFVLSSVLQGCPATLQSCTASQGSGASYSVLELRTGKKQHPALGTCKQQNSPEEAGSEKSPRRVPGWVRSPRLPLFLCLAQLGPWLCPQVRWAEEGLLPVSSQLLLRVCIIHVAAVWHDLFTYLKDREMALPSGVFPGPTTDQSRTFSRNV